MTAARIIAVAKALTADVVVDETRYAEITRMLAADANRRRAERWDDIKAGVMKHRHKPHWQDGKG